MIKLNIDQVIKFHKILIAETGGEEGIRDKKLLESAINNAYSTFDGIDLYNSIEKKCVNICFNLISNHPFIEGNKRIGIFILLILFKTENINLNYKQEELVKLGLEIAKGNLHQRDIIKWIDGHKL